MSIEEHIQKGFNHGYHLEKHDPALSLKLQEGFTDKEHPYVQGFNAGREEYTKEQEKDRNGLLEKYLTKPGNDKEPPAPISEKDEPEIEI